MGPLEKALAELDEVADGAMAKRLGFAAAEEKDEEEKSQEEEVPAEELEKLKALLAEE